MKKKILSSQEFQIKNLQNQLKAERLANAGLLQCLDNVNYFVTLYMDMMRHDVDKSKMMILAAVRGDAKKPTLCLTENT